SAPSAAAPSRYSVSSPAISCEMPERNASSGGSERPYQSRKPISSRATVSASSGPASHARALTREALSQRRDVREAGADVRLRLRERRHAFVLLHVPRPFVVGGEHELR